MDLRHRANAGDDFCSARDNGKENGSYYIILGLYWDNGEENGNYYIVLKIVPRLEKERPEASGCTCGAS